MARFPSLSEAAETLPHSILARLMERTQRFDGPVVPFHIGDTYLLPPEASRISALDYARACDAALYRYSKPSGALPLKEALVDKLRHKNAMPSVGVGNVQVTCGATHGLSCAMRAIMDPGDTILLLTPYWPLIRGIAVSLGMRILEQPLSQTLLQRPNLDVESYLESSVPKQVSTIYVCNPNNPDGVVFPRSVLEAIARFAERRNVWIVADEVYENFVYDKSEHTSIAAIHGMGERTLTAFSFSKTYAQAGLRIGYVHGPGPAVEAMRKMVNHTVYSVPLAMQRAALAALVQGETFLEQARAAYAEARDLAWDKIVVSCSKPAGATYLFLDLSPYLGASEGCCLSLLNKMADQGILLTPGSAFGLGYEKWARLCFSAVRLRELESGIYRLNQVLETC